MELVTYQIDRHDTISMVSDSWAAFAMSNGAPRLASGVIGHSLWGFVSDPTTRLVYQDLLARVRGGRTVTFSYRCDSPAVRRFMQMTMSATAKNGVEFNSLTLRTEFREPSTLNIAAESNTILRGCSWCKRIEVNDEWVELEVAIERLGLLADATPTAITHGMCPPCFARIVNE